MSAPTDEIDETHQKTAGTFQIGTTRFWSLRAKMDEMLQRMETVSGYFCVTLLQRKATQPVAERCRTKNAMERGNHGLFFWLPQATTLSFCASSYLRVLLERRQPANSRN